MINRSAITVRAKQPFLKWLRSLPDPVESDMRLEEVNDESHVYLLPEYGMINEQEQLIKQFFDLVFESELEGWWTNENDWPSPRDMKMFKQWFDIEFHSMIQDLTDEPLIDD